MNLPAEFTGRMKMLLKDEYEAFIRSYREPRHFGLRVNTLKCDPEWFRKNAPFTLTQVPWISQGCYYVKENTPARHPYYRAGLYYLQEPSAMTPADVLPVETGDKVLDLCAAPGGKSTAIGAKLGGRGFLLSNDISAARARALLHNIETFGITNAAVTSAVPDRLARQFPGFFDKVLVDAPCSGEGMFRKDEAAVRAWSPDKPEKCAVISRSIVLSAADMLRPGGMMLYSTCTFAVEENEAVIAHLLKERPEMELVPVPEREGFAPGITPQGETINGLERCVRLWPHRIGGEGHFMALLQKAPDAPAAPALIGSPSGFRSSSGNLSGEKERELIRNFFERIGFAGPVQSLSLEGRLKITSGKAFLVPPSMENAGRMNILRSGLYLGDLKKDRFEPSQALAMALDARRAPGAALKFEPDDPALERYFRGEVLESSALEGKVHGDPNGWKLVCVEDYPLGWGKLSGGRLKNHLGSGWRSL